MPYPRLIEFTENYMQEKLRICDRAVGAFWPRSPALSHWSTMMNLCLVGEGAQRVGQNPISSRQRLALMYIMEAAIRRAEDEVRTAKPSEKDQAATRMNEARSRARHPFGPFRPFFGGFRSQACMQIIPEIPRLMDLSRPEDRDTR